MLSRERQLGPVPARVAHAFGHPRQPHALGRALWCAMRESKQCSRCREVKPLADFTKCPRYTGGYSTWCRTCHSAYSRERNKTNAAHRRAYWRAYSEPRREHIRAYGRQYCREHLAEFRARLNKVPRVVRNARERVYEWVKLGKLTKGPCTVCGTTQGQIEGHHEDYGKPLDVLWLCAKHHSRLHKGSTIAAMRQEV